MYELTRFREKNADVQFVSIYSADPFQQEIDRDSGQ